MVSKQPLCFSIDLLFPRRFLVATRTFANLGNSRWLVLRRWLRLCPFVSTYSWTWWLLFWLWRTICALPPVLLLNFFYRRWILCSWQSWLFRGRWTSTCQHIWRPISTSSRKHVWRPDSTSRKRVWGFKRYYRNRGRLAGTNSLAKTRRILLG